jgi:serine/threonine protein kinase/WD40 repeat protein
MQDRQIPSTPPANLGTIAVAFGYERTLDAPGGSARADDPTSVPATRAVALPYVDRDAYTMGQPVGQGGTGRVLQARDQRLDRPVAIKELLARTEQQEQRFVREALLTARLQHPAIVPVYEAGRWPDGEPFYAMKLVSGRSLADASAECTTFAERLSLLPHVLTAAHAIAYAHSKHIIHRDLKPANVLVGEFGETVVIDWGLAKDLTEDEPAVDHNANANANANASEEGLTIQGVIMGTPWYMPPEQAAGEAVDERADVYALGAMLYHVLAAIPPHHETPWERLLPTIAAKAPRPIERLVPQLSDELAAIVNKAMARDPEARYRTAEALADDLERFAAGQLVAAHTYSLRQLLRRYWRRNRSSISIAAAAMVLVVIVVLTAFVNTDRARRFAEEKEGEAIAASHAAQAERQAAEEARTQATARADGMTLLQAQQALEHDPNQALVWLASLSPEFTDAPKVRRIAADAQTRGISRAFRGHAAYVNRFDVSVDHARFVTASDDKTVRVWDVVTGTSLVLTGNADEVWNARFSAGGAEIATLAKDGTLRLWDAATGVERATIELPAPTRQLVVRTDGTLVGGVVDGGAAWILRPDAPTVERLVAPDERPRWAYVSPDGRRLIVQLENGEAYIRDIDGEARRRLPGTHDPPGRWILDPHGDVALHLTSDSSAIWDLTTMTRRGLDIASHSRRPAFSSQGDRLAVAVGADVHVYDTHTAALVRQLVGHEGPVETIHFADDDRTLVSGGVDRTVRSWSLDTGRSEVYAGFEGIVTEARLLGDGRSILAVSSAGEVRSFEPRRAGRIVTDHGGPTTGLALSADGRVASIDARGRLRIHDLEGRTLAEHTMPPAPSHHLVASPDGRSFAGISRAWVVTADGRYPDPAAGNGVLLLGTFDAAPPSQRELPAPALDLAWVPDSSAVVVGLADGGVLVLGRTGEAVELDRFSAPATSIAISSDGAWVAAGSEDGSVRLTERASSRHRELAPHAKCVTVFAFAIGDVWLASGCADHTARLWRRADGTFRSFDEGGHGVEQVAFSADGRTLILLSGGDTGLRRRDVETGEPLVPLAGHQGKLVGFSMGSHGRRLLTFGEDGAVRVIDMVDGEGRTLAGHTQPITGAGFAAGGRVIVTLGYEGTVRVWPDDLPESMPALREWIDAALRGSEPQPSDG